MLSLSLRCQYDTVGIAQKAEMPGSLWSDRSWIDRYWWRVKGWIAMWGMCQEEAHSLTRNSFQVWWVAKHNLHQGFFMTWKNVLCTEALFPPSPSYTLILRGTLLRSWRMFLFLCISYTSSGYVFSELSTLWFFGVQVMSVDVPWNPILSLECIKSLSKSIEVPASI